MTIVTDRELADRLSQLVWEHASDFLEGGTPGGDFGADLLADHPVDLDEVLIFFLWVHTHVVQQAYAGRYQGAVVKRLLDAMHRRVFADLEEHGIPASRLPIFEQVISSRYADYYGAAKSEDRRIGELAAALIDDQADETSRAALAAALAQASVEVAGPLRDFLLDVRLAPEPAVSPT
ncbi:MAG TPA: hypothetical protein VF039_08880 [Longimicrobiales bacterium]